MLRTLWRHLRYHRRDIRRYGAMADSKTDCTEAFKKACQVLP